VTPAAVGSLITVTQLGYAAGVLLLVPLGDTLNRARLIPFIMAMSVLALLASALAPNFASLLGCFGAVGLTTVSGQLLVPLAGDLAGAGADASLGWNSGGRRTLDRPRPVRSLADRHRDPRYQSSQSNPPSVHRA
jgi:MFS family permease